MGQEQILFEHYNIMIGTIVLSGILSFNAVNGLLPVKSSDRLSDPSCSPIYNKGVDWKTCYFEKNQWFGITTKAGSYEEAIHTCQSAGGEFLPSPIQILTSAHSLP